MSEFVDRLSITDDSGSKKEININFGDPLAREQSQRAVTTSEQAKQTADEAKQIAQEAKDAVPGEVSQQVAEATQKLSAEVAEAKTEVQNVGVKNGRIQWTNNDYINSVILSIEYEKGREELPMEGWYFVKEGGTWRLKKDGFLSKSVVNGFNEENIGGGRVYLRMFISVENLDIYEDDINGVLFNFNAKVVKDKARTTLIVASEIAENNLADTNSQTLEFVASNEFALSEILINKIYYDKTASLLYTPKDAGVYKTVVDYTQITDGDQRLRNASAIYLVDCRQLSTFANVFVSSVNTHSNTDITKALGIFGYGHMSGGAMFRMFHRCTSIKAVQFIPNDTPLASLSDISEMFYGCRKLEVLNFEQITFSSVTKAEYLFYDCWALKSITMPAMSGISQIRSMFERVRASKIDMRNVDCKLVTGTFYAFYACNNLKDFSGLINICVSYKLNSSSLLSHESALNCIAGLYDLTEGGTVTDYTAQTLTFHPDVTAQLTEEEIAEATAKGWNIA